MRKLNGEDAFDLLDKMRGNVSHNYLENIKNEAIENGNDDPTEDSLFNLTMGLPDEDELYGND